MTNGALLLTARDVMRLLDLRACIDAVEEALRLHEQGDSLGVSSLGLITDAGSFHVKAAGLKLDGRSFIAAKANMNLPGNPAARDLPTIQGVLILLDAVTGVPLAVMDSGAVTTIRTGAVTGVAARHLALEEADDVTIVGCGEQGEIQLRAMAAVRPIRRARAIDVVPGKAHAFADRMSQALGIHVEEATDAVNATRESSICVTCTTAHASILTPDALHAGLLLAAVGADNPAKRELDSAILPLTRVVVDSLSACAAGGELHHALDAGLMNRENVHGELSAVVVGRVPGRRSDEEVFLFDSTGTALMDVAAAALVYDEAVASGTGSHFTFGVQ